MVLGAEECGANSKLVGPFGGEAVGFAKGVADLYSKNFYILTKELYILTYGMCLIQMHIAQCKFANKR